MKQLILSISNYTDSKINAVIKYIYHELNFDYVQKNSNMYNNNIELTFYKNDKILKIEERTYLNLVETTNFDKNILIISDSRFIHEQLLKCNIKVYKNKHFYYVIVDEVLKTFIKKMIDYFSNYTICKKESNYINEIGTTNFVYDYTIETETQLEKLIAISSKSSGYHLLPKKTKVKDINLYVNEFNLKITILNNALDIDDFYYNIEDELIHKNHLFITKKINELIKPNDKKIQKKKFLSVEEMLNFCFSLDLLDIKCVTDNNIVYYTHDTIINNNYNNVYKYKYCIKHSYDTSLSYLSILAIKNRSFFSNYDIKNTTINLDIDIKFNKLHNDKYQLLNKSIVLDSVLVKEDEKGKYIKKKKKRYKRGDYLSLVEKYNYYLNNDYNIKVIDI